MKIFFRLMVLTFLLTINNNAFAADITTAITTEAVNVTVTIPVNYFGGNRPATAIVVTPSKDVAFCHGTDATFVYSTACAKHIYGDTGYGMHSNSQAFFSNTTDGLGVTLTTVPASPTTADSAADFANWSTQ